MAGIGFLQQRGRSRFYLAGIDTEVLLEGLGKVKLVGKAAGNGGAFDRNTHVEHFQRLG